MSEQKKEFTGVWIPRMVVEDEELNWTDRACYAEIACYQKCFASNAFLAKRLGISESRVSKIIARLKQLEYLEDTGFNGRFRMLATSLPSRKQRGSLVENSEAASLKTATIDNSVENSRDNSYFSKEKSETKDKLSGNSNSRESTKEEETTFHPTNDEGDEVGPKKEKETWVKEKEVEQLFAAECVKRKLPRPSPVASYMLRVVRKGLKEVDEVQPLFDFWFETAMDENVLNVHSCFSAGTINRFKSSGAKRTPKSNDKYDNIKVKKFNI